MSEEKNSRFFADALGGLAVPEGDVECFASGPIKVNGQTSYGTLKNYDEIRCHTCSKRLKKKQARWLFEFPFCSKKCKKKAKRMATFHPSLPSNIMKEGPYKLFPCELKSFDNTLKDKKRYNDYKTRKG